MELTRRGFMGTVAAGLAAMKAEWIGTQTVEAVVKEAELRLGPVLWIGEDAFRVEQILMNEETNLLDVTERLRPTEKEYTIPGLVDRTLEFECEMEEGLSRDLMDRLYACETNAELKVRTPEGDLFRSHGVLASVEQSEMRMRCEVLVSEPWELM